MKGLPQNVLLNFQLEYKHQLMLVFPKGNLTRGGSRGRVQGMRTTPPSPRDDLRFSNTTVVYIVIYYRLHRLQLMLLVL